MRHSTFTESEIFSMGAAPDQNYYPLRNLNPSSPSLASAPRGLRGIPSMESTNVTTTSLATNATNADAAELGLTVDEYEFYEKTEADHRRMIFMILFFLFFMILYIGFCAYYRKRNKVRRAVEDTTVRTRERQRSANQIVLDESSDATRRARTNAYMQTKLKKRLANIKRALYVRIIVNNDDIIDDNDEDGCMGAENGVEEEEEDATAAFVALKSKLNLRMWGAEGVPSSLPIAPALTIVEEEGEDGEEEGGLNEPESTSPNEEGCTIGFVEEHSVAATVLPQQIPLSLAETRSVKNYIDALNCSGRKSNSASPVLCDDDSLTKKSIVVASTSSGMNRYHRRSIPHSTIISMYGEECNICLSQFQVGDRAAWSLADGVVLRGNNDTNVDGSKAVCKHVFHEECITRWLLVRDKCPICRETYFPDNGDDVLTTANSMSDSSSITNNDVVNNGNASALERGENSNYDENLRSTPLIRRMIERFDIR